MDEMVNSKAHVITHKAEYIFVKFTVNLIWPNQTSQRRNAENYRNQIPKLNLYLWMKAHTERASTIQTKVSAICRQGHVYTEKKNNKTKHSTRYRLGSVIRFKNHWVSRVEQKVI